MRWSSILGGLTGEDARYDAFATLMQILRVKAEHPEWSPEQYSEKDEEFRWAVEVAWMGAVHVVCGSAVQCSAVQCRTWGLACYVHCCRGCC
jgi:hypothetical protein